MRPEDDDELQPTVIWDTEGEAVEEEDPPPSDPPPPAAIQPARAIPNDPIAAARARAAHARAETSGEGVSRAFDAGKEFADWYQEEKRRRAKRPPPVSKAEELEDELTDAGRLVGTAFKSLLKGLGGID